MDYNGYILTAQPPANRRAVIRAFEQTGGLYVSEIAYVLGKAGTGETLGLMSAPNAAKRGDLCFIRCASTAFTRSVTLYRQMGRDGWPQSACFAGLRERCQAEKGMFSTRSGNVLAVAPVIGPARLIDGKWYARLGEACPVNGGNGVPLRSFPPYGRAVSTHCGITMLKPEETSLLAESLGLNIADRRQMA